MSEPAGAPVRTRRATATIEALVGRVERSERLERWSAALQPTVERLTASGGSQRRLLTGAGLGHPAHPATVTVPLGCWTAATALDVVGGRSARSAAQRLVACGVLAAVPSVATGLADWLDTRGAERRTATAHAAANTVAVGLYGASWILRRGGRHGAGVAAGLVAALAASGAGFLGGHLTYRRGVGVDTTAFEAGPSDWAPLDLPTSPADGVLLAVRAADVPLVAYAEPQGVLHVLEDRCTHRGAPLHEGRVDGSCLVCPWHASRFDLATGAVVAGPASAPQPVYEVRVRNATVEVRRDEPGDLRRNPVR